MKTWIIFDARARYDIDSATVYEAGFYALKKARKIRNKDWPDGVIVEYVVKGKTLLNGKVVG